MEALTDRCAQDKQSFTSFSDRISPRADHRDLCEDSYNRIVESVIASPHSSFSQAIDSVVVCRPRVC